MKKQPFAVGGGLLSDSDDSYEEADRINDALRKRREKLAAKEIGLQPDAIDRQDA